MCGTEMNNDDTAIIIMTVIAIIIIIITRMIMVIGVYFILVVDELDIAVSGITYIISGVHNEKILVVFFIMDS